MTPTKVTVLEVNQNVGGFSRIDITTSFFGKGHILLISPCCGMTRIDGIIEIVAAEIGTGDFVARVARIIFDTIKFRRLRHPREIHSTHCPVHSEHNTVQMDPNRNNLRSPDTYSTKARHNSRLDFVAYRRQKRTRTQ